MLLALTVAALAGAYSIMKRRDVRVLEAPARAGPGPARAPPAPVPVAR